jgi:hypothetical protein
MCMHWLVLERAQKGWFSRLFSGLGFGSSASYSPDVLQRLPWSGAVVTAHHKVGKQLEKEMDALKDTDAESECIMWVRQAPCSTMDSPFWPGCRCGYPCRRCIITRAFGVFVKAPPLTLVCL